MPALVVDLVSSETHVERLAVMSSINSATSVRYLTVSELVYINGKLLNNEKLLSGKQEVRDLPVARPAGSAFGEDAYPTLPEKVAALVHSVVRNHPFTDGNKRTAAVAALFMLRVNGCAVTWEPVQALQMILDTAQNRIAPAALATWFPLRPCQALPDPDAERDMRVIQELIQEHRWLLDELSKR
jgi:death-on-curing protein